MTNAKREFLDITEGKVVKAAQLQFGAYEDKVEHNLRVGFTPVEFEVFLEAIDFEYDSSYGSQQLFGIIWFTDGTWADRDEYDGAEDWQIQECPAIPESLSNSNTPSKVEYQMEVTKLLSWYNLSYEDTTRLYTLLSKLLKQEYQRGHRDALEETLHLTKTHDYMPALTDHIQAELEKGDKDEQYERL